jgi:hypothetical protein
MAMRRKQMPDVEALIADALRPKEIGVIPTPISRPDPLEDQINQLAMQLARDHQHIVGAKALREALAKAIRCTIWLSSARQMD